LGRQQETHAVPVAANSPVQAGSKPPAAGNELGAAQAAVNELALSMSGSEADAAYALVCCTTLVLLRRSIGPAGSSKAAAVRSGLLEMYQVVAAGNHTTTVGQLDVQLVEEVVEALWQKVDSE
jgi:hypothetical protein